MPQSGATRTQLTPEEMLSQAAFEAALAEEVEQQGVGKTVRSLKKGRCFDVYGGVAEELPNGLIALAVQTNEGPLSVQNARRSGPGSTDPQSVPSRRSQPLDATTDSDGLTTDELLRQLTAAGANPPCSLLCRVELARFHPSQRPVLLPLLWKYVVDHRDSNNRDELVAVGAAVRKYIAIMPMDRMGELTALLETGHRSPLPIELEIEVAKMVYRNFETHPPDVADPQPELARRFWEMVQAYINPRILLRDKHSAATSLAIEAIVSMRSPLARQAWQAAVACPYRWFAELVSDDLEELQERWSGKNSEAAAWLRELRNSVLAHA